MKYIKLFIKNKLFETKSPEEKLADQFDDDYAEKYYDDHADYSIEEVIDLYPKIIEDHIDDERYIDDFIDDEIDYKELEDFEEYDIKRYLNNNWDEAYEQNVLDIYNENNSIDDETKETKYEEYMFDALDSKDARRLIDELNLEEDFIRDMVEGWYKGKSAMDIMEEFYGKNISGKELYKILGNYIDDDAAIQAYKDGESLDYKREMLQNNIDSDQKLQKELLKMDKDNVLLLAKVFENSYNKDNTISNLYSFQKLYIKKYSQRKPNNTDAVAKAIKYLYDNFELNPKIEEKYSDDMWMINAEKYNL